MSYYVFRSLSAPLVAVITDDPIGDKLPVDYAPWAIHERSVALVSLAETPEHIAAGVAEKGYYLVSVAAARPRKGWWRRDHGAQWSRPVRLKDENGQVVPLTKRLLLAGWLSAFLVAVAVLLAAHRRANH